MRMAGAPCFSAGRVQKPGFQGVGSQSAIAFKADGGIGVARALDSISPMAAKKAPRTWQTISAADITPHCRSSSRRTVANRSRTDCRSSRLLRVCMTVIKSNRRCRPALLTLLRGLYPFVYPVCHPDEAHFPAGQFFSLDGCSGGRKACPGTTDSLGQGPTPPPGRSRRDRLRSPLHRAAGRWVS
jgi:hypothetical protein